MTKAELIELLETVEGDDTEIRLAAQPAWPMEYLIDDPPHGVPTSVDGRVAYLVTGEQVGYLPGPIQGWLGWGGE